MWEQWKKRLWQGRGIWITAPSITIAIIILRHFGLLQGLEWAVFDQYLRWRPPETRDERVAIVGIYESDHRDLKQAIINDGVYAELLKKLEAMSPRGIGLDIYRDQPVEPGHQELVKVFQSSDKIIGIEKVVGDTDRRTVSAPPALKEKGQVGINDIFKDADNKVRRVPVSQDLESGETMYGLGFYLSLLYLYGEEEPIMPENLEEGKFRLGEAIFSPFESNDGGYIRADSGGYQMILHYRGNTRHFETVSLHDILEDRVPPDWGRDRIILIGAVSESANDLFSTPHTNSLLFHDEPMPGVEIHANFVSQVISAAMDDRPLIKSWGESSEWLWIFLWSVVGSTLTWTMRHGGETGAKTTLIRMMSIVAAMAILMIVTFVALLDGWWIAVVPPFLGLAGSSLAITAYVARTAGDIRKTFGRYLSNEIVANLLENPEGLKMGGERREITIFTSDLRGFTAIAERLPPEEVVKILNFYLGHMADVITKYQGTIDEFMGDGILVLFGAPITRKDDAQRAVACGIAMQLAMEAVNQQMKEWGLPALEMGIGIHTGEVVVGNIGSEKRTKYGVVGSQVNLTYRIESYTTGGQVIISPTTLEAVGENLLVTRGEQEVQPKGVIEPIAIYDIGGIKGEHNLFLPTEEEEFVPLEDKIQLKYTILAGKHVGENTFYGSIVWLSDKGAQIYTEQGQDAIPPGMTNIKLNLLNYEQGESEDIYAKVLEQDIHGVQENSSLGVNFMICFTAKPPDVAKKLEQLYSSLKTKN